MRAKKDQSVLDLIPKSKNPVYLDKIADELSLSDLVQKYPDDPSHFEVYRDALEIIVNGLVHGREIHAATAVLLRLVEIASKMYSEARSKSIKAGRDDVPMVSPIQDLSALSEEELERILKQ